MNIEEGCTELVMVQWPHPVQLAQPPIILDVHAKYLHERLARRGSNISRPRAALIRIEQFFGCDVDPTQIPIQGWNDYIDFRVAGGVLGTSVRKEITFHQAAMNHAKKLRRLQYVPYIEMPSGEVVHERRAATEAEYALLMRKGLMSYRTRMFFRLAHHTGHRAEAIEQLEWSRVDFVNGTIDFNLPGVVVRNKRRNAAFPITDELLRILEAAKVRRDMFAPNDPYVIGAGKSGRPTCTYVACKAAWSSIGIDVKGLARHTMRKKFVTERLRNKQSRDIVAQLICDKPDTMSKHYAKFIGDDMRKVAANG